MQTRWVAPEDLFRDDPPEGPGVSRGGCRTTLAQLSQLTPIIAVFSGHGPL